MKSNKQNANKQVYQFLRILQLKFRPNNAPNLLGQSKITKGIFSFIGSPKSNSNSSKIVKSSITQELHEESLPKKLKFFEKISPEHFIIGNESQLDMIFFIASKNFIDVQNQWQLALPQNRPIQLVAIDQKKSIIAIVSQKTLYVYKYDLKKRQSPSIFKTLTLPSEVKFLQFPKDLHIVCFFNQFIEVYLVTDEGVRKKYHQKYNLSGKCQIFSVPPAFDQTINIFFFEEKEGVSSLSLWSQQIQFLPAEIKLLPATKIYDIKRSLKNIMKIDNFSKEVFLINLGSQILAFKKGYVIDSAGVDKKHQNSVLRYLSNQKLLHITDKKAELYHFTIDKNTKPHRIVLKPMDSINIQRPVQSQFVRAFDFLDDNLAIFYQTAEKNNTRANGEIVYWCGITQPIKLQEKIKNLFPPNEMEKIKTDPEILNDRCDMALKMGLSIKETFLQLWNRTDRNSVEDYQLLLATKDYQTIKYEIQRKLKKASMKFRDVIRIEQACYDMLEQEVFSTHCTEQSLQNYIVSHFFLRKLGLLKDTIIQQKKRSQTQQQSVLNISIQQYHHYEKVNIKEFFLEEIANFGKTEKSLLIKLIIRDFKFVFRVYYEEFLEAAIAKSKDQLFSLLREIPKILPYTPGFIKGADFNSNEGFLNLANLSVYDEYLKKPILTRISSNESFPQFLATLILILPQTRFVDYQGQLLFSKLLGYINDDQQVWSILQKLPKLIKADSGDLISNDVVLTYQTLFEENFVGRNKILNITDDIGLSKDERRQLLAQSESQFNSRKQQILNVLKNILPQYLPNKLSYLQIGDESLFEGVWTQIKKQQFKNNLYVSLITTIDNRNIMNDFVGNIWYMRNWLSKHDLINKTKDQIQNINKSNNSDRIFYVFIAAIFEVITDNALLKKIVKFLQINFDRLPKHLYQKIFLYRQLFSYLKNRSTLPQNNTTFTQFLNLRDYQLFHHFFKSQRNQKGFILKLIKPIYQNAQRGSTIFNESLLSYFNSQLSSVSDLKYILNRINNQKAQFHEANEDMYAVLISAMLMQLKVGTEDDIDIDQVLIYIQNIPLAEKDNNLRLMEHVLFIQEVRSQAENFKQMKLNMSLIQIIEKSEEVMSKMVLHEMQKYKILQIKNWQQFKQLTYEILAKVQMKKQKLYSTHDHYLPLFVFLCKMLEDIERIAFAALLVDDSFLKDNFAVDLETIQNLVLYMYRWKFNENPIYQQNQKYIKQLVTLLPKDNDLRKFLEYEVQFAVMLSSDQKIQYPLTNENEIPSTAELQEIFSITPAEHLLNLNYDRLYQIMDSMQTLAFNQLQSEGMLGNNLSSPQKRISQHQIYQLVILRLIELGKLKQVLPFIEKIITFEINDSNCNIVYPIVYIMNIASQFNNDCLMELLRCLCYYFHEPSKLLQIVSYVVLANFTNEQRRKYLLLKVQEGKKNSVGYSMNNFLFSSAPQLIELSQQSKLMPLIQFTALRLKNIKDQFSKNIMYVIMVRILCNQPYVMVKLLFMFRFNTNWRFIRAFLSYAVTQTIFDPLKILQFGKRAFIVMLEASFTKVPIESVIYKFLYEDINKDMPFDKPHFTEQIEKKFYKSIEAFERKKKIIQKQIKAKYEQSRNIQDKLNIKNLEIQLSDDVHSRQPTQYPFQENDSDNDINDGSFIRQDIRKKKGKKRINQFKGQEEMKQMVKKKQKDGLGSTLQPSGGLINSYRGGNITASMRITAGSMQRKGLMASQRFYISNSFNPAQNYASQKIQHLPRLEIERQDSQVIVDADDEPSPKRQDLSKSKSYTPAKMPTNIMDTPVQQVEEVPDDQSIIKKKNYLHVEKKTSDDNQYKKGSSLQESIRRSEIIQSKNHEDIMNMPPEQQHTIRINIQEDKYPKRLTLNPPNIGKTQQLSGSFSKIDKFSDQIEIIEHSEGQISPNKQKTNKLYNDNSQYLTKQPEGIIKANFSVLQDLKKQQNWIVQVKDILSQMYQEKQFLFTRILTFLSQLSEKLPQLGLNKKWIDIYLKAENIHEKYSLQLPIRDVFPINGLYFNGAKPDDLFHFIKPQIIAVLNEINVYKTVKVISLAFRNTKLQQEVIFCYLKSLIQNHIAEASQVVNVLETQMLEEKITVLLQKVKPDNLIQRIQQIFTGIQPSPHQHTMIDIIVTSVQKRSADPKIRQAIIQKANKLKGL